MGNITIINCSLRMRHSKCGGRAAFLASCLLTPASLILTNSLLTSSDHRSSLFYLILVKTEKKRGHVFMSAAIIVLNEPLHLLVALPGKDTGDRVTTKVPCEGQ